MENVIVQDMLWVRITNLDSLIPTSHQLANRLAPTWSCASLSYRVQYYYDLAQQLPWTIVEVMLINCEMPGPTHFGQVRMGLCRISLRGKLLTLEPWELDFSARGLFDTNTSFLRSDLTKAMLGKNLRPLLEVLQSR